MGLREELAKPRKVKAEVGALALGFSGLPLAVALAILLPLIFVTLGVGLYITFQLLPFVLVALVFFFCYWVGGKLHMPETHNLLVSFAIAMVALFLPMVKGLSDLSMGLAQAQSGEIITITLTMWSLVAGALFLTILALGVYFKRKTGSWSSLTMALAGFVGSLMMGGASMTQGLVVEPTVGAQFLGSIVVLLFGGIIVGAVVAAILGLLIPLALFFLTWWLTGVFIKEPGPRLMVRIVLGAITLFPLYRGVVGLSEVSSAMPPMPLIIVPLTLIVAAMIFYAVKMRREKW